MQLLQSYEKLSILYENLVEPISFCICLFSINNCTRVSTASTVYLTSNKILYFYSWFLLFLFWRFSSILGFLRSKILVALKVVISRSQMLKTSDISSSWSLYFASEIVEELYNSSYTLNEEIERFLDASI